jgi:hypothetical protein
MRTNTPGRLPHFTIALLAGAVCCVAPLVVAEEQHREVAEEEIRPAGITWYPHVEYQSLLLTVSIPGGQVLRREFKPGQTVAFPLVDKAGNLLPNGSYTYELRVTPLLTPGVRRALAASRATRSDSVVRTLQATGKLPNTALTQSGYFSVAGGSVVMPVPEPDTR